MGNKIIHCCNILWHYRLPTYAELSRRIEGNGDSLIVRYWNSGPTSVITSEVRNGYKFDSKKGFGCLFAGWRLFISCPSLLAALDPSATVLILEWNLRDISLIPATCLARALGKRVIWWGHGVSKRGGKFNTFFNRLLAKIAPNRLLLYTEPAKEVYCSVYGLPDSKVFVAPNGVDIEDFVLEQEYWVRNVDLFERVRDQEKIPKERTYLLYSGRLLANRDLERIIHSVKDLTDRGYDVGAIFIGDGPFLSALSNLASANGIAKRIVFAGAIYDIRRLAYYYRIAKICVIPGWLGLSLTQAAGMGLPSVISNNSELHNPEIAVFKNGETGVMYDYRRNNLTEALVPLVDNAKLAAFMGGNAKRIVQQFYSKELMVDGIFRAVFST